MPKSHKTQQEVQQKRNLLQSMCFEACSTNQIGFSIPGQTLQGDQAKGLISQSSIEIISKTLADLILDDYLTDKQAIKIINILFSDHAKGTISLHHSQRLGIGLTELTKQLHASKSEAAQEIGKAKDLDGLPGLNRAFAAESEKDLEWMFRETTDKKKYDKGLQIESKTGGRTF